MTKVAYNNTYGGFRLTDEVIDYLRQHGMPVDENGYIENPDGTYGIVNYDIERHNPLLIEALEKHPISSISIAEIYSNKYWIWEYDGIEQVYTPETIPWVTINS